MAVEPFLALEELPATASPEQVVRALYRKHSITGASHSSKVASALDMQTIPVQFSDVHGLDVSKCRARMNDRVRERFDLVYSYLTVAPPALGSEPKFRAPANIIRGHVENGIMRYVTPEMERVRPTLGWVEVFLVKEECEKKKAFPEGKRLRTICWTKYQNAEVKNRGYEPHVPLQHISAYLEDILDECAGLRDHKSGFYQIRLPQEKTAAVRGIDDEGNLFEMLVASMGHTSAPECMQILSQVVAGDPMVCKPQFAVKKVCHRTWVDGSRVSGTRANVVKALEAIDRNALAVGATYKEHSAPTTSYDFIGVTWDHSSATVAVAQKTKKKLWKTVPTSLTPLELEAMVGRLLFCSGVLRLPPARFYYVLKFTRRLLNRLNRGLVKPDVPVEVPTSVLSSLKKWLQCAKESGVVKPIKGSASAVLFSDASLDGWGGVLILEDCQIFVVGAKWRSPGADINELESLALQNCLHGFDGKVRTLHTLHVRVDNTTLMYGLQKGKSSNERLAGLVDQTIAHLQRIGIAVTVEYISTKLMPADYPSRGREVPNEVLKRAIGELPMDLRRGRRCAALRIR